MKAIHILENNDTIQPTDYCRLLYPEDTHGDYCVPTDYKWKPVNRVFGAVWFGETVEEINKRCGMYEFVRGSVPPRHIQKY